MARALVTVVFTDIVGSTELRSTVGDDEADRVVARHDGVVAEVVEAHGGRVVKYLGDGALATFASAVDGAEAAASIQARLLENGPPVRIGIHAGDVETSDGDIAGLPVAVASRLCGIAPSGGVVVSGLVRSLVGARGDLRFESMGAHLLKGVTDPVEAWRVEVDSASGATEPGRLPPPTLGRRTGRFVGRHAALAALDAAFGQLGRQRLVAVSGEPGIGKTALVGHWAEKAYSDGATVLVGSAPPEGVAPYQPFIEAIRPLLRLDPAIRPRGAGAANLARLMPELSGASTGPPLLDDPNTERYVINEAFVELLAAAAGRHPRLVVILDDLHWADEASLVLLGHLLRHTQDLPVLVVGTYRDTDLDRRHPLADLLRDQRRARRADRLDLAGLDAGEVAALVASVAGASAPDSALEVIVSETEGNPFFVEEIVEHLVAEGMVVGGAWEFDPQAALTIPEGVRDTVGRRLDRLTVGAQDLLAAASVIGSSFDVDVLVEVAGGSPEELEGALEEALASGFLVEGRGRDVSFSHALIRQTILNEISHLRRSRLHRRAGEALAAAGASADRLVHHWIEARQYPQALEASLRAMRDAEAVAALSAVAVHAGTILELWDEVSPAERPAGLERHHAIVAAAQAIGISRGWLEGVEYLQSHRAVLEAAGDARGVGVVLSEVASQLWPLGRVDEALDAAERAIGLIPAQPPTSERARAEAQLGRLLMLRGSAPARAVAITSRALETARAVGDSHTETAALATLGVLVADPVEAEQHLRKGLEMATTLNAVFQITRTRTNLSELLAYQGRHDEAIQIMGEGLDLLKRLGGSGQSLAWMVANLADRLHDAGRWSEALEVLDITIPPGYAEALQLLLRARIQVHRGEFDPARRLLNRIVEEYGHISDVQFQAPLATAHLWLARWSGELASLSPGIFDRPYSADEATATLFDVAEYLLAAAEMAVWGRRSGRSLVDPVRFEAWMETADSIAVEPVGHAIRATLRAARHGFERADDPEAWATAVEAWPQDTFERAVSALGWLRSAVDLDSAVREAGERALVTADRLGAAPLAGELRALLSG
jgi:class 3 adenylate cyclase/tetratricopeptide (TPR) repeat protein